MKLKSKFSTVMAAVTAASMVFASSAMAAAGNFSIGVGAGTDDQWAGVAMTNDDKVETGVCIREGADEDSPAVGFLYRGGAASVIFKGDEWSEVKSGNVKGFVKNEFLTFGTEAKGLAEYYGNYGVRASWNDVNVFSWDDKDADIIGQIDDGATFPVVNNNGHWIEVQTGKESTAYVSEEDVDLVILVDTAYGIHEDGHEAAAKASAAAVPASQAAAAKTEEPAAPAPAAAEQSAAPAEASQPADDGSSYTDTTSYDDGSSYTDTTSYDDGSSYTDTTSYDDGSSYTDTTSYDDGSSNTDTTSYDDGSNTDTTSYDDGSSYTDTTSYDDGSSYTDTTSYDDGSNTDTTSYDDGSYTDTTSYDDGSYTDAGSDEIYDAGSDEVYDAGSDETYEDVLDESTMDVSGSDEEIYDDSMSDAVYDDGSNESLDDASWTDTGDADYYDAGSDETVYEDNLTDLNDSDLDLLASIIYCEAGNQSYDGMVGVGAVVMNRVASGSFPDTISDVVYQSGQFTPASSGVLSDALSNGVPTSCYEAAVSALSGEDPTGGALYFNTSHGSGTQIGDHWFY